MNDPHVTFYRDSKSTWEAMLADIERATVSIDFERYIFVCDTIGQRFIDAFIRKAKQGVKIRILCDMVGSLGFYLSQIPVELSRIGIQVQFFNPISLWRIGNFSANLFRDHRKLLIIDGNVGYIGGIGMQDHMADWRDTEVRIEGGFALHMRELFESMWHSTLKRRFIKPKRLNVFVKHYELVTNAPHFRQRFIYRSFISAIRNAKRYIYLTTPYFVPDLKFLRVLRLAAKRGVDVRLLVPEYADHYFVTSARESYFTLLLKSNIRVYKYHEVMMHTKTAVIDDEWATVGSFNLDSLSFLFNYEANVVSSDREFAAIVKEDFFNDLRNAHEVHYEEWIRRPLLQKLRELLTWPMHKIM
jgi:cardiolipin synthase A/B